MGRGGRFWREGKRREKGVKKEKEWEREGSLGWMRKRRGRGRIGTKKEEKKWDHLREKEKEEAVEEKGKGGGEELRKKEVI